MSHTELTITIHQSKRNDQSEECIELRGKHRTGFADKDKIFGGESHT